MHVKKGDTVKILSGDDKGRTGKIIQAFPRQGKVVIEGMNTVKRHERPRKQGQKGQVVERPMPMYASKVKKI
ncbi:MAG: 50S ribosomal protein L24 [Candidatus Taylorbacteria bacterium RIFCSPLOWO2_01_FULL_44_26]|uniref:Large ribosomal subunit protein uL24 n=2 Tax=Candidatus Tayloriibacteriota TaxID=1817919 RepID=A0A1G2ML06_9BACT|nr:MAG: 50S ribosomal protein L24 [Candidatus Taylorbacteria bacterium RIFCSPHIGHO2_02_FULL_44_12]OHA31103.1 MAG: 50S ribosomal protein L24 [Candidatus Taylorbacteria bacterium RIFCSPLOWO2_01_FULL_44_26]